MAYDDPTAYAKYLKKKCMEEGHNHEGGCDECKDGNSDCDCCPPGLVSVIDENGRPAGCLTPNDAALYNASPINCNEGFAALYKTGSPNVFLGCVSEENFVELYAAVNP